jgi:DNA mismatch repair ATPase MutS
MGAPTCLPEPRAAGARTLHGRGLYDVCLALALERRPVANEVEADGRDLVIVTGANQGGKSTFLRSVGLAQVMLQCGMFVPADRFAAELCAGVCTHWKREEDVTMKSGKLDEELARMSAIADAIEPNAMVLFNESFASTNEREGSEVARQIVGALVEKRIKVLFVTHLHDFARTAFDRRHETNAVFLRAERLADGTRTFRVVEGRPLETSFGQDLYREVFEGEPEASASAG